MTLMVKLILYKYFVPRWVGYNPLKGYTGNLGCMVGVNSVVIDHSGPDSISNVFTSCPDIKEVLFVEVSGVQPS